MAGSDEQLRMIATLTDPVEQTFERYAAIIAIARGRDPVIAPAACR
jgi:hypothetical protein